MEVVIVSHKRAGIVLTHEHVEGAKVCVPESQVDQYAMFHDPDTIVAHPDSVVGLCSKRQWVYDTFGDVVMLDDRSIGLYRVYREPGAKQRAAMPPDRAREVIEATAETARQLGAKLFGWGSHAHVRSYEPGRPFRFGGYTPSGALGLFKGSKLFFPKNVTLPVDDYWICGLNAYYHRYCFLDMRFSWAWRGTYVTPGGMREFRVNKGEVEATRWLRQQFGDAIVYKRPSTLTKTERNPSPRTLRIPYSVR